MGNDDVKAVVSGQTEDSVENLIPTDEELSAAFDAAELELEQPSAEPVVEETVSVEAEPTVEGSEDEEGEDEDLDEHKDRSRMGRRLKRLEGTIESLLHKLEAQEQQRQVREYFLQQQLAAARQNPDVHDEPNMESELVSTDTDVERVMDKRERRKAEEAERYQNTFVATLNGLAGSNPKMHKVIVNELITNFNKRVTGNPQIDARLNYAEAKSAVMAKIAASKTVEKPKPNIAGNTQSATGVSASSTAQKTKGADIWSRLDKEAAEYARAVGMKEDDIEAALAGETPINLKTTRRIG